MTEWRIVWHVASLSLDGQKWRDALKRWFGNPLVSSSLAADVPPRKVQRGFWFSSIPSTANQASGQSPLQLSSPLFSSSFLEGEGQLTQAEVFEEVCV